MLWRVEPDYIDYDLHDGAIVVADTKEEAEKIADDELNDVFYYYGFDKLKGVPMEPQVWTATLIDQENTEKGVLFDSFKAG